MDPLQIVGSLVAILALVGLARWLGLGREPRLTDEDAARRAADEAIAGFVPIRCGLEREGRGALLEDAGGRILLLKPHGSFFAGRVLGSATRADRADKSLSIDSGERRFGRVTLVLEDAAYWEQAINRLEGAGDA
ncbi:MAG: hypothetical protein EX262_09285 [Sphingomonadaceae bacterium]|nr:MAG: hypothetical protein EX262_09285 [Sphingomonadaceae bacterium]